MKATKRTTKAKRAGFIVAALILVPALIIARLTVTGNEHVFWACVVACLWSEYRLGWMK